MIMIIITIMTCTFGSSPHRRGRHRTVRSAGPSTRSLPFGDAFDLLQCSGHTFVSWSRNWLGHPIFVELGVGMVLVEVSSGC